jgi:hypothetical protein
VYRAGASEKSNANQNAVVLVVSGFHFVFPRVRSSGLDSKFCKKNELARALSCALPSNGESELGAHTQLLRHWLKD